MTPKSTDNVSLKNGMTDSELFYYRHWRNCGIAIMIAMICAIISASCFLVARMFARPGYAIACGCVIAFALFVAKIKCTDAERYHKRAFPRGDTDGVKF
jgi:uncharacterized membrane protein YdfJ with MMPL/SSD domain